MIENKKLYNSFSYAWEGIYYSFKYNQNLRVHTLIAILVIILGLFFHVNAFEIGILGVMVLLVIASEMINTAIEEMVNLITKEYREEAKIAKDVSAGMVLITAIGAIIVGVIIFLPYVIKLFSNG